MTKYGIIYKATSPSGKVYIGQTTQTLSLRKSGHNSQAFSKSKTNKGLYFSNAIRKYRANAFKWEQIDSADTAEELNCKEQYWITFYDSMNPDKGYNRTSGGLNYTASLETRRKHSEAQKGKRPSPESRRKLSEAHKGQIPWNKGVPSSVETRKKLSEYMKGKKLRLGFSLTAESRRRTSEAKRNPSAETRRKISEIHKGKKHSEETRRKMSVAHRGEKGNNTKLTEATARAIKTDLQAGMRNCDIARKYGVSRGMVGDIKRGKNWAWVKISA